MRARPDLDYERWDPDSDPLTQEDIRELLQELELDLQVAALLQEFDRQSTDVATTQQPQRASRRAAAVAANAVRQAERRAKAQLTHAPAK